MALSKKAQTALNKVVAKMKAGDLSPIVELAHTKLDPLAPASKWTYSNQVLAYMQTANLDCRGYRQWQQVGRQVKKGASAAYILGPRMIKRTDKETGEETRVLAGFVGIPVFAMSDTEGDPVAAYQPKQLPPLMDVARRLDLAVTYEPLIGALGSTDTKGTRVKLSSHDVEVFYHELAHAIHARMNGQLRGGQHTSQETVAELTSCVLMALYGGGDNTGNTWQYIAMYADRPMVAITKALADVASIIEWIEGGAK